MTLATSIKVNDTATDFFKKFKVNIIRAGGSEDSLELSYATIMDHIINYFKKNNLEYSKMVQEVAKDV